MRWCSIGTAHAPILSLLLFIIQLPSTANPVRQYRPHSNTDLGTLHTAIYFAITMYQYCVCMTTVLADFLVLVLGLGFGITVYFMISTGRTSQHCCNLTTSPVIPTQWWRASHSASTACCYVGSPHSSTAYAWALLLSNMWLDFSNLTTVSMVTNHQ